MLQGEKNLLKTGKTCEAISEQEFIFACLKEYELNKVAWYCVNSGENQLSDEEYSYDSLRENNCTTHPVAMLKSNELGIYDMSGNVWEWCSDIYSMYPSSLKKKPSGKIKNLNYMIRGGGFADISNVCRIANRGNASQHTRTCDLGFRLALSE